MDNMLKNCRRGSLPLSTATGGGIRTPAKDSTSASRMLHHRFVENGGFPEENGQFTPARPVQFPPQACGLNAQLPFRQSDASKCAFLRIPAQPCSGSQR